MNRKRWKRAFQIAAALLCLVLLLAVAGLYQFFRTTYQIYEAFPPTAVHEQGHARQVKTPIVRQKPQAEGERLVQGGEERVPPSSVPKPRPPSAVSTEKGAELFLLLGVDSRKGERARSDTILLAVVPKSGGDIHLLSIPRDTYANVPGRGYTKINHAMSYGGAPLIRKTVEQFFSVPIDHTVTVDFEGFRRLVDELGGLPLTVEKEMHYDDPTDGTSIHLLKGQTIATGKQALDYARFRNDSEADTGRMRRQKQVIRAIIQKSGEPESWPHLFKLADLLGKHVKTDLPPRDWVRLAMAYRQAGAERVKSLELAGENRISPRDHLWYFFVTKGERARMAQQLRQLKSNT
jgi:LCP family protein required for cell wall assembly